MGESMNDFPPSLISLINGFTIRLFLKVHHTTQADSGEKKKVRFIRVDVALTNEVFAAADEA